MQRFPFLSQHMSHQSKQSLTLSLTCRRIACVQQRPQTNPIVHAAMDYLQPMCSLMVNVLETIQGLPLCGNAAHLAALGFF